MSSSNPPSPLNPPVPPSGSGDAPWVPTQLLPRSPAHAPAAGNALPIGTSLGEFEIMRILGEGGFGIVYLAQDHMLQRPVAVKEYMPATLSERGDGVAVVVTDTRNQAVFDAGLTSFINEARLLAHFDHPSLVKVHRFWKANGTAYMVMPFYEGTTLKDALKARGTAPDQRWLMAMLAPLTEALAVLHAERCFHRDIAPDNILLLAGSGKPLLLDFGAARLVIGDATQALTAILKPGYAPVEQYAETPGLRQGPWTDIYALCAVVHMAIMGKKPQAAVARMVSDSQVPLTSSAQGRYSHAFLEAIDGGLHVHPEERIQSIAEFRIALGLDSGPGGVTVMVPRAAPPASGGAAAAPRAGGNAAVAPAPPVGKPTKTRRPPRRGALYVVLAAVAAAAIGALAWWTGSVKPVPPPPAPVQPETAISAPQVPAGNTANPLLPAAWSASAEFDRIVAAGNADYGVRVKPDKPRLRIDKDRLAFTVSSARDGYLYVLAAGTDGSLLLLYPNLMSSQNQIRAGQSVTLPQANWPIDTGGPPGTATLVAIVSRHPRDFAPLGNERDAWFLKLPTGTNAVAATLAYGGTGSVLAGRAACHSPGCDAYGAVRFSVEVTR